MLKLSYLIYWKVLTVLVLAAVYYHLFSLYYSVTYRQTQEIVPAHNISTTIEICYELALHKTYCKATVENRREPKEPLKQCDFSKPIACYTEGMSEKSPQYIIKQFKDCGIENLTNVISESNGTSSAGFEYELFMNYICVKYRFDVQPEEAVSMIKIWPEEDNKQNFHIIIQGSRAFENQPLHSTVKQHLLERYCWIASWKDDNETYHCTEDEKEIDFELFYFSQVHLPWPFDSNCVHRDGIDQHTCFENCIKKHANYYQLTYSEQDDQPLANEEQASKKHIDQCASLCSRPDCVTGTYLVPRLVQKNSTTSNFIVLEIDNLDRPTEARSLMNFSRILYAALVFAFLFFGVNLRDLFIRATNLYNNPAKPSKQRKLMPKRVLASIMVFAAGVALAVVLEMEFFDFGNQKQIVLTKIDSIKERNVSVSICYDLCSILNEDVDRAIRENCSDELLMQMNVGDLDKMTWSVKEFKPVSSMRNSVRIVPIRQEDFPISVFFREFKKCFLLFYDAKNIYPPISLQRKSFLHLNSSNAGFAYFYIEDDKTYPQLDAPKNKTSYLHNVWVTDYRGHNCTDYAAVYGTCSSRDECIQQCVLKRIYNGNYDIPISVNLKLDNTTEEYLHFKFDSSDTRFKLARELCERKQFPERECYSKKTTLRTKHLLTDPHDISVTLTPKLFYTHRALDESTLLVINRILSFFILLTGISVKGAVKGTISNYFYSLASFCNYTLVNRAAHLVVFLFYTVHLAFLFCSIVGHPMHDQSYRTVLDVIVLPKIRVCYEIRIDLSEDKHNKLALDRDSLNVTEILESVTILDRDYRKRIFKIDQLWSNNSLFEVYDFYVDNLKCFNFNFQITYPALSTNILESDKLVTLSLNISKVPKRRVFIHMNSENSIDLEWYYPFEPAYYNIMYITEDLMFQDDFWLLKNFFVYIKSVLGLEKLRNTHHSYYLYLRDSFFKEQYVTTTVIPLGGQGVQDATIRNHQFNSYIHFRSLAGNKNAYDFRTNTQKYAFMSDFTSEKSYLSADHLVVSFRSILLKFKMLSTNRYRWVEFCLHLFILTSFWFKLNFIDLPTSLQKAYDFAKFFLIVLLYCIVVFLLFVFETWFKLIRFLDFKYA